MRDGWIVPVKIGARLSQLDIRLVGLTNSISICCSRAVMMWMDRIDDDDGKLCRSKKDGDPDQAIKPIMYQSVLGPHHQDLTFCEDSAPPAVCDNSTVRRDRRLWSSEDLDSGGARDPDRQTILCLEFHKLVSKEIHFLRSIKPMNVIYWNPSRSVISGDVS